MSNYIYPGFLAADELVEAKRLIESAGLSAAALPELYTSVEQAVLDEFAGVAEGAAGEVRRPITYLRSLLQRVRGGSMEFTWCYRILARRLADRVNQLQQGEN